MPKSITISLLAALIGVLAFAYVHSGATPQKTEQDYINVALSFFNATAIICLFVILNVSEKKSPAKFGAIIRDNISTVIVALLINLIGTVVDIVGYF